MTNVYSQMEKSEKVVMFKRERWTQLIEQDLNSTSNSTNSTLLKYRGLIDFIVRLDRQTRLEGASIVRILSIVSFSVAILYI